MSHLWKCLVFAAAIGGVAAGGGASAAEDRPAEAILQEIDALKPPKFDREKAKDKEAVRAYIEAQQAYTRDRSRLVLEFLKAHPDHPRSTALQIERFEVIGPLGGDQADDLVAEADAVLAKAKDPKLRAAALHLKASSALRKAREDPSEALPAIEEFLKEAPADPRGPRLLYAASRGERDDAKRDALEERILKDFADSSSARAIKGQRKQRAAIGKPFELEFADAITGSKVSVQDLKGKVVVIDFWATWCGPCIAEIPNLKKLYEEYHDRGLEIVGVSLDRPETEGGLKDLKDYVAKNEIRWHQYYQGNYWQSEFSSSWGINGIPTVFIVDTEGKLASVEARGKLEELVPKLLKAKEAAASATAAP